MLLSITTTQQPASDLGFLLHKHPDRFQSFNLSFGKAHVFYPESSEEKCTACLLLDVDSVELARGRGRNRAAQFLAHYVNDRPYVASSFMSVAISRIFGTALQGQCKARPELVEQPIPFTVQIDVLPVRGGEEFLRNIFEPLGYEVAVKSQPVDEKFSEWGESHYFNVTLNKETTLSQLLKHLYILIPVFDNVKHYFVGEDEIEKLIQKGEGWLADHPMKEQISKRYLKYNYSLTRMAMESLREESGLLPEEGATESQPQEEILERPLSLNEQRLAAVLSALKSTGAKRILDLGCGEGKLLRDLMKEKLFTEILGMDVSVRALEIAHKKLKLDRLSERESERIRLIHGSLIYRDERLKDFDAAAVVEVIEHLDPPRLIAFERILFKETRPNHVIITTPNSEYNVMWETLPAGKFRHSDHRFEWTREEFQQWSNRVAKKYGYHVRFLPVGPEEKDLGSPTQMGLFERNSN
jgi:3' terminal RNA ribose 2'-O-methyltransferase Hen1